MFFAMPLPSAFMMDRCDTPSLSSWPHLCRLCCVTPARAPLEHCWVFLEHAWPLSAASNSFLGAGSSKKVAQLQNLPVLASSPPGGSRAVACVLPMSDAVVAQEAQRSGRAADVLKAWRDLSRSCS